MFLLRLLMVFCASTFLAHAQYSGQPAKESTSDLRSQTVLFSIQQVSKNITYLLERTASQDYFLRLRDGDDDEIRKIAGKEALKLDREFASKFLRCQYELETVEGKCDVTLRLSMKGESQEICKKDEKKSQEFASVLEKLAKRF